MVRFSLGMVTVVAAAVIVAGTSLGSAAQGQAGVPANAVVIESHNVDREVERSAEIGLHFAGGNVIVRNATGLALSGTVVYEGYDKRGRVVAVGEERFLCLKPRSKEAYTILVSITGRPVRHRIWIRDLERC